MTPVPLSPPSRWAPITPHSDILSFVNESQAAAAGIKIDIIEFSDYVQPNSALADGSLDANYFQHKPYLDQQIAGNSFKFSVVATVHLEPMGVYSEVSSWRTCPRAPRWASQRPHE